MNNDIRILVVDDEPMNRTVMTELLGGDFNIKCAEDSSCCMNILDSWIPDLILMDVKMPEISGLETCRQIRANDETEFVPIIFVSALNSPEERIAGYEAGGDDYIVKPYDDKELVKKIHLSIENSKKLKESQEKHKETLQTAMTAMKNTAEVGNILHFYQDSFNVDSYEDLNNSLLSVLSEYGLTAVVSVFIPNKTISTSNTGAIRPIEISVIEQLRKRESNIFNFGNKTSYSYSNITILVLNMPIEDEEKCGRLRDNVALLAEGGNARIKSLISEYDTKQHETNLQEVINVTSKALHALDQQQKINQNELENIMGLLSGEVESSFFSLGLSDEQEKSLLEIVTNTEKKTNALFDKDQVLRKDLEKIILSLKRA